MKTLRIAVAVFLVIAILTVVGCKKDKGTGTPSTPGTPTATVAGIDLSKSIADIKAAAEKMDVAQLRTMAEKCITAVKENESKISALMEQQKALPLDKMATDAQKIMDEVKGLQGSMSKLQEIFKVYYDALVAKGGDTSGLQM